MVQDYDARGPAGDEDDDDDDFYTDRLELAIDDTGLGLNLEDPEVNDPPVVIVDNHAHIYICGDGLEDDWAEDTEIDENAENMNAGTEQIIPRPMRGRRVNY